MNKIEKVMHEFKEGDLHSGAKSGPVVKGRKQALAIAMSEARKSGSAKGRALKSKYTTTGKRSDIAPDGSLGFIYTRKKVDDHYSPENQRKMHYDAVKTVVKKAHRGERYRDINKAFPIK